MKSMQIATVLGMVFALSATAVTSSVSAAEPNERNRAQLEQKLEVAQRRLDEAAREVAELSVSLSGDVAPRVMAFRGRLPQRAMLGITVAPGDDREEGVEIASVSPGGAAAEAGLKAGDVLLSIEGKPLRREGDRSAREQLLERMRDVEPEQQVKITYRRDNKVANATIRARPFDHFFTMAIPAHPGAPAPMPLPFLRAQGVFGSAELVALTPKLGQYFGTDKGLLVVRAPSDSRLQLEDGDVILDIDGRTPSSPSHALRILSSYQGGEKLKLSLLRAKKRVNVEVTVPDDVTHGRIEHRYAPDVLLAPPAHGGFAVPVPPPPAGHPVPDNEA